MSDTRPKTPADMLDEVLSVISREITKIAHLSGKNDTLSLQDSKSLNDYAKTLMSSSREKRESAKSSKVENLKDEDLLLLAEEALNSLKTTKKGT